MNSHAVRCAIIITILALAWPLPPATAEPEPALTLADCYALALKQSEVVAIHQELINEAEARLIQARSGILPRASFESTDKRQDGSGASAFTLRHVPERRFAFSQPLFSGFREFAAMAEMKAERRQRIFEKTRAEQLLLIDVAEAFYLLLEQREDLGTLEMIRGTLQERIDELHGREQLGRSRPSEVVSAEAQLLRIEAEEERVRNQETIARQTLEFLTGRDQIRVLKDTAPSSPAIHDESSYLVSAPTRPDVQAAQEAARAAQSQISVARADLWPSAHAEGNYYVERAGVAKDIAWDASLVVSIPIFEGGQVHGAVRQANAQEREAELQTAQTRRQAVREIRDAYATLYAINAQREALIKALNAADENYRLQVEDYRRNLVNNLDVLQGLQNLEDARRDFIHAQYETKRSYWRLRAATGQVL